MASERVPTVEAIILAGGFGTRLKGLIGELPKPMARVAGRPFLEWQIDFLKRRGIRRVILSVGYRREAIEAHFGDSHDGLSIDYAREDEPLGTGGAIRAALGHVRGPSAFVLNGDTLVRAPLARMDERRDSAICLLVARVEDASRYGTVSVEGGLVRAFREKGATGPGFVNSGVYRVDRNLFDDTRLPERFSFERDFMEPSVGRRPIAAVETDEPFIDIGIPESLAAAETVVPALAASDLGG